MKIIEQTYELEDLEMMIKDMERFYLKWVLIGLPILVVSVIL